MPKIIQISSCVTVDQDIIIHALDENDNVWERFNDGGWVKQPSLPEEAHQ